MIDDINCDDWFTSEFNEVGLRKKASSKQECIDCGFATSVQINECVQKDLINYIAHKYKIIKELEQLKETSIEDKIHNLLILKGIEKVPIEKNNLWLLDDKFISYNYVASDKEIKSLISKGESQDIMDIAIYSNKGANFKKAVVFAIKKTNSSLYRENGTGINQLFNYGTKLYDVGIKELYLYLITNIDDSTRRQLTSKEGFVCIRPTWGEVYKNYYKDINAHLCTMTPGALIASASARYKDFIDAINA